MRLHKVIEQLGYSPNEAKVYLAALSLGDSHISDIAAKVKLPRTSVQLIVDKLHRDGLLNFYIRRRYKHWVAESPERLLAGIKEREELVMQALPELTAMRHASGEHPIVKIFAGPKEIERVFDDIIATKHNLLSIVAEEEFIAMFDDSNTVADFVAARIKHYLHVRSLIAETPFTRRIKERDSAELRQTRFLPKDVSLHSVTYIYGNKVALISLNKKLPTAIVIEDTDIKDTMTLLFEELWQDSTE